MKKVFTFFFLFTVLAFSQTPESMLLQHAMSAPSDSARVALLDSFAIRYPESTMLKNVFAARYSLLLEMNRDSAAIFSLRNYISKLEPEYIPDALNSFALDLVLKDRMLDSAYTFVNEAISMFKRENLPDENNLLSTQALILYKQKKYSAAKSILTQLIKTLPARAEFNNKNEALFLLFGLVQFDGERSLAGIKNILSANLFGINRNFSLRQIDSLFGILYKDSKKGASVRDSMLLTIVNSYIKNSDDSLRAKAVVSVHLSRNNMLLPLAQQFVLEAYRNAKSRTIEERSGAAAAAGLVFFNSQQYERAESYLAEAAEYASPNESEIFLSLGQTREALGKKNDAFTSYMRGVMNSRPTNIYSHLEQLHKELYPVSSLDSMIVAEQTKFLNYVPQKYERTAAIVKKNTFPRIVLAELFTGSECKPCQAADVAFDYLLERFDAMSLTILEYHINIPLADPMSNPSSDDRASFYGINNTPTIIIGGRTVLSAGGSRMIAKNKFLLFSDVIEKEMSKTTTVQLTVASKLRGKEVNIIVDAHLATKNLNAQLHIALIEDEIFYSGSNGIKQHKFVVRKILKSPDGYSFRDSKSINVKTSIDLNSVESELKIYADEIQKKSTQTNVHLKERRETLDIKRLAIVAFVQDKVTREVLQSKIVKVN